MSFMLYKVEGKGTWFDDIVFIINFFCRSFASIDGIFCIFQGTLENLPTLRQEYGLGKNVTEVMLVIEAYRTLRDRGPFPPDKVVADLEGHFVFVVYDTTNQNVFVALVKSLSFLVFLFYIK